MFARLILAFATKALRSLCESAATADHTLGAAGAARLRRRLADLIAAGTVADLPTGKPRNIARSPNLAIDLGAELELVFGPNHNSTPSLPDGSVDWSRVKRIKILRIGTK
jgi:hypothetical protein